MARKVKETLGTAGDRKKVPATENDKPMTVQDKVRILAMSLKGAGKKEIAGKTGFAMDWIATILDVFSHDREFLHMAANLNSGKTVDTESITDGQGGAKRG